MDWYNLLETFKKAYFSLDDLDDIFYAAGCCKPFWLWFAQKKIISHLSKLRDVYRPDDYDFNGEQDE